MWKDVNHAGSSDQRALRRDNRFLTREYRKVLFPIMFAVLGGTINALIDSLFVSWRMGGTGLSAVNLSLPVYLILCTLGSLVASGASLLSAREEGRENMQEAEKLFHTALTMAALIGVAVTVAGLVFLEPLVGILTVGGSIRSSVEEYCRVTLAGAAVYILSYIPLNYLQLEGKTRQISRMIFLMVVTDVLLDYLLLYPFHLGLTGAALASVLAMLISCSYGFAALVTGFSNYHFDFRRLNLTRCGEIFRYGSPAALGNLYDTGKLLAVNRLILMAGGEQAMAIWAVLNSFSEFSLVISSGVSRAGNAMMGVYHTARENSGIRTMIGLESRTGAVLSCLFAFLVTVLAGPIQRLYAIPDSLQIPLLCLGLSVIFETLCCVLESCFSTGGRIAVANLLVVLRRLVFPVAVLWGIAAQKGILWLFLPFSSLLALLAALLIPMILSWRSQKTDIPLSRILLLDDRLTRENKVLDFSIPAEIREACMAAERISDFCRLHDMDARMVMRLGLAIEELLNVIITKSPMIDSVDLRVFVLEGNTGIRIRCAGQNYDPFNDQTSDRDFLMGVEMLKQMADVTMHSFTLGFNTLNIIFRRDEHEH